jgi:hypothetical protein
MDDWSDFESADEAYAFGTVVVPYEFDPSLSSISGESAAEDESSSPGTPPQDKPRDHPYNHRVGKTDW